MILHLLFLADYSKFMWSSVYSFGFLSKEEKAGFLKRIETTLERDLFSIIKMADSLLLYFF